MMKKRIVFLFGLFLILFLGLNSVEAGHISCGQTITTDTVLDSDLINCPNHGIIIGANGITLDCNGHSISGTGNYNGIYLSGRNNNVIQNCNIQNFFSGIYLVYSPNNILTGNTANSNGYYGIYLNSSDSNTFTGNTASSNNYGIKLYSSDSNTLISNTANSNDGSGILLSYSSSNTLTGNTANSNNLAGIVLYSSSSNNTLTYNIADSNNRGILLGSYSNNNTLTGNTANSNGQYDGIYLYASHYNTLTGNTANSNNLVGIVLYGSDVNTLTGNTANSNSDNGIYLYDSDVNTLTGNTANSNSDNGIYLYGYVNTLTNNNASLNDQYGIRLSSSNNALSNNYVCSNTLSDFNVTSSSGNSGTGNRCDNPDGWNDDGIVGCTYTCTDVYPVLLVHGYCSDPQDTWQGGDGFDFYQKLVDEGKEVYLIDYAPGNCPWPYWGEGCANKDIRDYSKKLKDRISEIKQETGAPKVDLVAHSMGGLISRWYIQNSGYRNDVNQLIMLGTPNHGSQMSRLEWLNFDIAPIFFRCAGTGMAARQMKPKSYFNSMLNYNISEYNWTIWQSDNEVVHPLVTYRNLAGTGKLTFLLMKVPKSFPFENDGLDFIITGWGDSVVATYHLRFINPSVGCSEFYGIDHFQIHDNQNVFNSVLNFLNAPTQTQPDTCNYEDVPAGFTGVTEKQGFSPIIYDTIYPNEEHLHEIIIDSTIEEALFGLIWGDENSELGFTLITPSGNVIDENDAGFIGNFSDRKYYRVQNPENGTWILNITGDNVPSFGLEYRTRASFLSSIYLEVESLNNEYSFDPGSSFEIIAYAVSNNSLIFPANMTAEIINPDGSIDVIELFDDGLHGDYNASDGIYGNSYLPTILGDYEIFVTADGTFSGERFIRQFDMTNWVEVFPDLTLNSSDIIFSNDAPFEGKKITITANIHNIGNGDALNATIFFYDGDPVEGGEFIGEDAINILINQSNEASVLWTATAGNHSIVVFPSPYNSFLELDYSNEKAGRLIYVNSTEYRKAI